MMVKFGLALNWRVKMDKLIDEVLDQIKKDVKSGDMTAIKELIKKLIINSPTPRSRKFSQEQMKSFLSEV